MRWKVSLKNKFGMSITNQLIRNVIKKSHHHSAGVLLDAGMRGRAIHSLSSVRLKVINADLRYHGRGNICNVLNTFGRNTTSVFIISRNESTISKSPIDTSASGESHAQSVANLGGSSDNSTGPTTISGAAETETVTSRSTEATSPPAEVTSSSEVVIEPLKFESIPDPPAIPTPLDEVSLNALGEPSLASMGLGGWSPSGIVQQCLEFFHANMGMPWWASILTGTIIIRVLMFPLVVKSQRNAAKMQNNMPELQVLQMKMTEARQTGNAMLAAKYGQDMMLFMKEKDISPFKSLLVPLAMAPVFISCFFGLRKMANLPVESMKDGGLFWFTDLTIADPYYLLPLITSTTVWITLEIGVDGMKLNAAQHGQLMKYFMRAIPVIMFPFTINFPAAILCYWVSTNAISLIQVSILKIPAVREKLKIEPLRKIPPNLLPAKKKQGFRESLKESWTNMKITREIEDRQRYDEISFKRAGKGPIPKTYKYDPTKVTKEQVTAVHAKKK